MGTSMRFRGVFLEVSMSEHFGTNDMVPWSMRLSCQRTVSLIYVNIFDADASSPVYIHFNNKPDDGHSKHKSRKGRRDERDHYRHYD